MLCVDSPPLLNALENTILDSLPAGIRHVAVVGAGDGRLARALRDRPGAGDLKVSVVEPRPALRTYLEDFPDVGENPWDLGWFAARAAADGPFDAVVFYQVHEYWRGHLGAFDAILGCLAPGGTAWVSYLNTAALDTVARRLPPLLASNAALGDPLRLVPQMDLTAWMNFLRATGCAVDQIWALLEPRAYQFLQNPKPAVTWELGAMKFPVAAPMDAMVWGGRFHALQFHRAAASSSGHVPSHEARLSGSLLTGALYQGLLQPYPEVESPEAGRLVTQMEMAEHRRQRANGTARRAPGPFMKFLLERIDALIGPSGPRRLLVLDGGWGRDLLVMREERPEWELTRLEMPPGRGAAGRELLAEAGIPTETAAAGDTLPFGDDAFDAVVSAGYFCRVHSPVAAAALPELLRVGRLGVIQMEDGSGPDHGLHLMPFSLQEAVQRLGRRPEMSAVQVQGQTTGLYFVQWPKR